MKLLARISLFAFLFLASCGVVIPKPRVTHVVPHVKMDIHADTSFTLHERQLIQASVKRMYDQTNGFVEVSVVFDLDFDSIQSLREHSGQNIMTRIDSSVPNLDSSPTERTIGYCLVNFDDLDFNNPTKIALVHDRLPTDDAWIHVAMHEILHALRHQHIGTPQSIMYRTTPVVGNVLTCLVEADMVEICTVHGCDLAAMKPCKP